MQIQKNKSDRTLFCDCDFLHIYSRIKSTLFCGYILFSYSFKCTQTNLYQQYFKCICTYSVSNKHLFCIDIYINTLHGHNGFHILTKKHQRGNKYQRQHVEETSPIQNKQNTPKHYSFSICTRPAVYNGTVYFFFISRKSKQQTLFLCLQTSAEKSLELVEIRSLNINYRRDNWFKPHT